MSEMNFFSRHSIIVGRLLILLFVLANSGFTVVIRQCMMGLSHPMECCANSTASAHDPSMPLRAQTTATIAHSDMDCFKTTVVGGLSNTSALVEKESSIHLLKVDKGITAIPAPNITIPVHNFSSRSIASFGTISPPSTEKCVLNSTFLI